MFNSLLRHLLFLKEKALALILIFSENTKQQFWECFVWFCKDYGCTLGHKIQSTLGITISEDYETIEKV